MLRMAHLRSALFILGLVAAAGQPAIAEDLIDLLSAGVPDEVLSILQPEASRVGEDPDSEQIFDGVYGAAIFDFIPTLDALADSIFSEVKNLPVAPGVAAFTYELDPETNTYKRTGNGLGAIYSDNTQTLGKGRFNFGVAWSHIEYDEFKGTNLRNLPVVTTPGPTLLVSGDDPLRIPGRANNISILSPDTPGIGDLPSDGPAPPEDGLFWNLMDSDTSGATACVLQATETCSGIADDINGAPSGYQFESFGPLGDYLTVAGNSMDVNVNLHLDVELINIYLAYGVTDRFDIGLVMPFMENDVGVDVDVLTPFVPPNPSFDSDPMNLYAGSAAICAGDAACLFNELVAAHEEKYEILNDRNRNNPCFRACPDVRTGNEVFTRSMQEQLFDQNVQRITYSAWGDDGGIGDLLIRGKYRFLDSRYADVAGRLDVSFPTGDEDNFRGTGEYMWGINLIASKHFGWFSPHANFGVQLRTGGKENHQFRWAIGADARLHKRVTASVDFLGSEDLHHDGIGDTQMAVAPGIKINPWRNFLITTGVMIQVNHQGLRTDVIPTLGVEYTFF
jgi:hypothetical protein